MFYMYDFFIFFLYENIFIDLPEIKHFNQLKCMKFLSIKNN